MQKLLIIIVSGFILAVLGLMAILINPNIIKSLHMKGSGVNVYIDESISMYPHKEDVENYLEHLRTTYKDRLNYYTFSSKVKSLDKKDYRTEAEVSLYYPLVRHVNYLSEQAVAIILSDMQFFDGYTPLQNTNVHYLLAEEPALDVAVYINRDPENDFYQRGAENEVEILVMKNTPDLQNVQVVVELKENGTVTSSLTRSLSMTNNTETFMYSFSKAISEEVLLSVRLTNHTDHDSRNDKDQFIFKKAGRQLVVNSWVFKVNQDVQEIHNKVRPYRSVELNPQHFLNPLTQVANARKAFSRVKENQREVYLLFSPPYEVIQMFANSKVLFFLIPQGFDVEDNPFYKDLVLEENKRIVLQPSAFKRFFDVSGNVPFGEDFLSQTKPFKVRMSLPTEQKTDKVYSEESTDSSYFFMRSNMVFMGFYPLNYLSRSDEKEAINLLDFFMQNLILTTYKEYARGLNETLGGNYFLGQQNTPSEILKILKVPFKGDMAQIPGDMLLSGVYRGVNSQKQAYDISVRVPYREFFSFVSELPERGHLLSDGPQVTREIIDNLPLSTIKKQVPLDRNYYLYIFIIIGFCLFAIMRNIYKNA